MKVRIADMNWMQVGEYLENDDRAVVPLGSTEQHGYLSLAVDALIPEKLALDAAEPLEIPVFPALAYGVTPYFSAFPGTVSLSVNTYGSLIRDVLDSLSGVGFRRVVLLNGHGGNVGAASAVASEWRALHPGHKVKLYNWWLAPRTQGAIKDTDPIGTHASWMENFPWTRLEGVALPTGKKPLFDVARKEVLDPDAMKEVIGDGNYGGEYQKPDEEMMAIWEVAVAEAREVMEAGWA